MSAEVFGMENLFKNLSNFKKSVVENVRTACEISQAQVVNDAKANHPYTDRTQNLSNSIQPGRILVEDDEVQAEVVAGMPYASFVEFGTSRARPYPFMVPALMANRNNFVSRVRRAVLDARP